MLIISLIAVVASVRGQDKGASVSSGDSSAEKPTEMATPQQALTRGQSAGSIAEPKERSSQGVDRSGNSFFGRWVPGGQEKVGPVISFGKMAQKDLDEMTEDLNVLALILAQHVGRVGADSPQYELGVPLLVDSQRGPRASYVEGFGAFLSFHVPFPLIAPSAGTPIQETSHADTEWDKTKRTLYSNGWPSSGWDHILVQKVRPARPESAPFNADLVEQLKRLTLDALNNATHLRHLAATEVIVVTVIGAPTTPDENGPGRPTIMTVRINKSDVENAAASQNASEQLQRQATIHTYLGVADADYGGLGAYTVIEPSRR